MMPSSTRYRAFGVEIVLGTEMDAEGTPHERRRSERCRGGAGKDWNAVRVGGRMLAMKRDVVESKEKTEEFNCDRQ